MGSIHQYFPYWHLLSNEKNEFSFWGWTMHFLDGLFFSINFYHHCNSGRATHKTVVKEKFFPFIKSGIFIIQGELGYQDTKHLKYQSSNKISMVTSRVLLSQNFQWYKWSLVQWLNVISLIHRRVQQEKCGCHCSSTGHYKILQGLQTVLNEPSDHPLRCPQLQMSIKKIRHC